MPWNGAGLFTRVRSWVTDQTNGLSIQADLMDSDTNDIAAGIQACLAKNGENAATANLPMGGFRHTGVGDGTARTHYASLGQVQDGAATYVIATGTANALTLAYSPAIVALVDGMELRFKAAAANTGAATAAVNAIAAKAIKRADGSDIAANDILSGQGYTLRYVASSDTFTLRGAGGGAVWCGTSAGTANAQTLTSPLSTLTAGVQVEWIAGSGLTNTGALTLAVGSTTATAVRKADGAALTGGEVAAGTKYITTYDGTYWRLAATLEAIGALSAGDFAFNRPVIPKSSALTWASTITVDLSAASSGNKFPVTLGGATTFANPTLTSAMVGMEFTIVPTQDGTGSRTVSFGSYFKFPNGTAPTASTTAGKRDRVVCEVVSTTAIDAVYIKGF